MKKSEKPERNAAVGEEPSLRGIRTSIARNAERFAEDPAAAAAAADLIITLRRTATAIQRLMERDARQHGISPAQAVIVLALAAEADHRLRPVDIAHQLAVSLASLTPLLASLEAARLVQRSASAENRRVSFVALTTKGIRFVERFAPRHYRREAAAISVLEPDEQRTLVTLLDRLRVGLSSERASSSAQGALSPTRAPASARRTTP